jgi:hypothetical protein
MIRYVFDSYDQLARHLHVGGSVTLLFLASRGALPSDREAMVELRVRGEPRSAVVRGRFVAFAEGGLTRAWLQLPDARLPLRIHSGAGFALPRIARVQSDDLLRIRSASGAETLVRLLDVGPRGCRVRGSRGLRPGHFCSASVLAGSAAEPLGEARVLRVERRSSVLLFSRPVSSPVLHYLRALKRRWACAPIVEHPAECCAAGGRATPLTVHRLPGRGSRSGSSGSAASPATIRAVYDRGQLV